MRETAKQLDQLEQLKNIPIPGKTWKPNKRIVIITLIAAIVLSGAVFSIVHLTNLFSGGSPGGVILQIGYSFLIGSMCAVVLLRTANIWACVLIHTVYDFGGLFVPNVAQGKIWDGATVTITAVLGVLVFLWTVGLFLKTEDKDAERLLYR